MALSDAARLTGKRDLISTDCHLPQHRRCATGVEGRESGRTSDPDANWGKHETSGVDRNGKLWTKVTSWFGCKLHVIADTQYEIPVAVSLTRASASEVKELKRMASGLMGGIRRWRIDVRSSAPTGVWTAGR